MTTNYGKYRILFIVLAVAVVLFEIPGAIDLTETPYTGLSTTPEGTIARVDVNSPAARVGFQPGDQIEKIHGLAMSDIAQRARRPRMHIGETRVYEITRKGQPMALSLTAEKLPGSELLLNLASALIGFCFLVLGLATYLKRATRVTTTYCVAGLMLCVMFMNTPSFESFSVRATVNIVTGIVSFLALAVLLHFLMIFPQTKAFLSAKSSRVWMIYVPAIVMSLILTVIWSLTPTMGATTRRIVSVLFGLNNGGYWLASVIAFIQAYRRATSEEHARGLNMMLWGTIIGVLPSLVVTFKNVIAPSAFWLGMDYYFLTLILVPISFTVAVMKHLPAEATATAAQTT